MQNAHYLLKPGFARVLAFLLVIICLLPILKSGLYSDDLSNFDKARGNAETSWHAAFIRAHDNVEDWKTNGRYTPLSLYLQEIVFTKIATVTSYKIYILLTNLLAVLAFVFLLWSLGQTEIIALFLFFYLGEIQFRIQMHDAFTSLHGMYPLLSFFMFAGVAFYALYIKRNQPLYYLLSFSFCIVSLLISESGIVVFPVLLVCGLFLLRDTRKVLWQMIPFAIIGIIFILYTLALRKTAVIHYPGLKVNYNMAAMLNVVNIQLFSALPFSNLYRQKDILSIFAYQFSGVFNVALVIALLVGCVVLSVIFYKNRAAIRVQKPVMLVIISIIIFLVPAITLSPSVKYQQELWMGAGYLPVYIQNFGTALLLAVLASAFLNYNRVWAQGFLTILLIVALLGAASAFLFNAALIKVKDYDTSIPAGALIKSAKTGMLDRCPDDSRIILANSYHGYTGWYNQIFESIADKKFHVYALQWWQIDSTAPASLNCYLIECAKGDTIYTRLYKLDCSNGAKTMFIKCDTTLHSVRVTPMEEQIMARRY